MSSTIDEMAAEKYVEENVEDIRYVIRHCKDPWVRALCVSALVEYGDVTATQVANEIEQIDEVMDDD